MPAVTECCKPKGLPIATTTWPTRTFLELPSVAHGSDPPSVAARSTARSVSASRPTRSARSDRPSGSIAVSRSAPATTWLLVSTRPSGVNTTPEPLPRSVSNLDDRGTNRFDGPRDGARVGIQQVVVAGPGVFDLDIGCARVHKVDRYARVAAHGSPNRVGHPRARGSQAEGLHYWTTIVPTMPG